MTLLFNSPNEFSLAIETKAASAKMSCVEAIIELCDELDIDPEDVSSLVNKSLKEKLEMEYGELICSDKREFGDKILSFLPCGKKSVLSILFSC